MAGEFAKTQNLKLNNIVFVVGQLTKGGLERQLLYLTRQLKAYGVELYCVVWNFREEDPYVVAYRAELGERLIALPGGTGTGQKIRQLRGILRKHQPRLVVSFTAFVNFPTWLASLGLPCVALGSLRTSAAFYLARGGVKARLNLLFPQRILVNSHKAIEELRSFPLLSRFTRVAFFPNVLDLDTIQEQVSSAAEFQSISVGNARPAKRLDRLIEVMTWLKQKGRLHFRHLHVGAGPDLPSLKVAAAKAGLQENLYFLGSREDVYSLLRQSTVFLHFSEYEGSPNVIMEAMAAGLPVITTDCGDAGHYVLDGENGFLIESFSVESFAGKVALLLENEAQRAGMVRHSLEMIRASDWSRLPQYFLESLRKMGLNYCYPKGTDAKT